MIRTHPILRLIRIRLTLASTVIALILCIKLGGDLLFTTLIGLATFFAIAHVCTLAEINDVEVDARKYEVFEFYRKNPNPLVTGEIKYSNAIAISLTLLLITTLIGLIIAFNYNIWIIWYAGLAYILIVYYIHVDRGILGNISQSAATTTCIYALSNDITLSVIAGLYILLHNINNQIEDYEIEKEFYRTVPVQIGIRNTKILGIVLSIIGIVLSYLTVKSFVLVYAIIMITFILTNKKIIDYIRAVNYIILCLAFLLT